MLSTLNEMQFYVRCLVLQLLFKERNYYVARDLNTDFFLYIEAFYPLEYSDERKTYYPWSHGLRPKKLLASVAVPAAPVRVPSQRLLAPSIASATSVANDMRDNEMIPGAVHRSPGICLKTEENPGKPQLGDRLMKGLED